MGINLIVACHEHKVHSYSMRGEESEDLRWWIKNHGECFTYRKIEVYLDKDDYPRHYLDAWQHESRPKIEMLKLRHPELAQ